jgi:hypothetical protein
MKMIQRDRNVVEGKEEKPNPIMLILSRGRNGEATKERFRKRTDFYVPEIYWDLSTKKILTMEFIQGVKVNDLEGLQKLGVSPKWVRTTLLEVFAEMIFQHGVVHCDPHVRTVTGIWMLFARQIGWVGNRAWVILTTLGCDLC